MPNIKHIIFNVQLFFRVQGTNFWAILGNNTNKKLGFNTNDYLFVVFSDNYKAI